MRRHRGFRELAERYSAAYAPPITDSVPAATYMGWVTGKTDGVMMALNVNPQRRLWQQFWLKTLTARGAQAL